jgi:hypothetical protein
MVDPKRIMCQPMEMNSNPENNSATEKILVMFS